MPETPEHLWPVCLFSGVGFVAAVAAEPLARCWIWTILAWYAGRVVGTTKDPRLYEMVVWRYVCVFPGLVFVVSMQ